MKLFLGFCLFYLVDSPQIWFSFSLLWKSSMTGNEKMMVISLKKKVHNRRHNIDKKPLVVFKILNDKCPRIWRHFDVGHDMWNPSFMHKILSEYSPAFLKVTHV